jgi:hypothetical protein
MRMKRTKWKIVREDTNLMECHLIHLYRNPITNELEEHVSPDTKLIFIDISTMVRQALPYNPSVLQLPQVQQG